MNDLNEIYSFNNFLKKVDEPKIFDNIKYDFTNIDEIEKFISQRDISFFEFYTGMIALYLSRASNSNGTIFSYSNLNPDDTLFKIKYDAESSISDFITSVKNIMDNALDNSMKDLKDYVNELYPAYSSHIFNYTIVNQKNKHSTKNNDASLKFIINPKFIEVEYDANAFNSIEIEHMLENIESTMKNCLNDLNQPCSEVDIVCDSQLKLLNEFSKGNEFEIANEPLPDIILETAKKYPENYAINDEINRITYKKLSELIKSTTCTLQKKYNIRKSDKIILYLSRSYNIPLLTICLMKLGAVTIPVDESYPESYIQSIINDSLPDYIIQESDHNFRGVESIQLNALKSNETSELRDVDVDLDDVAMILYTSGSTGVPKGVELTQKNILSINQDYINRFIPYEGGTDNFMCLAKFTFVASLPLYALLMVGYEAFIIRETTKESIPRIVKYLMMYQCLVLISTPELGLYLYNNFDLKLSNLIFAGSKLSKSEIRSDSSTALFNAYGCTETSGSVLINEINKDYSDYEVIGRPLGSAKVYILDNNQKQLPIGSVGEIVVSGPVVTKQYSNNPEQTSKAYGKYNDERVFFTGDFGYFNLDGSVVYVGRKDNQINLNGFRIEPEGVESVISEYGDFNQIKVTVGEVNHENHLIAYYSSPDDVDKGNLKQYLEKHLPPYMIPSFYVQMDNLPVNQNGKIDLKSLPPVEFDETEFVEPRNEMEKLVVECFEKAFNQKNISVYDDFIQLGGTSIIAMKIVNELAEYNLTVNDLLSLATPEKIAEYLKDNLLMDLDFSKYSLDDACPLNESQLNVYLDIIKYDKNEVYNIPLTINIPENYSDNDVKSALDVMFDVHPILKSVIGIADGVPCLKTGNDPNITYLNEYDEDRISGFITSPFDLNTALSRFLLVKNDNNAGSLLVDVFHHLIFDGFSTSVFKKHLFELLKGKKLELDNGFIKSRVYDEEIAKTLKYDEAEAFYESMLSEVDEVYSLLSDVGDNQSGSYSLDLTAEKSDIRSFLKSCNITENILFISAFSYTLSRFTGDSKVLFNILDNGRDYLGNFESIGMFVNTLPLLVDCSDNDIATFIDDVRDLVFGAVSYNFYPFRNLAQKFNIHSSVVFQYQPFFEDTAENQFFNVSDLEFRVVENDNGYEVKVIHSSEFSSDTIKRFAKSYDMILNQLLLVDKLSDINYTSKSDVELLDSYNKTEHPLEYEDVLDAFNKHLARSPNSPLVSMYDRVYSYGKSAFIADAIAKYLIRLGVEAGDCVGFLTERCEQYIFAVLAILSVGGVYVPLDEKYPDERLDFMIKDTCSKVLIISNETYMRAQDLIDDDVVLLNISDIMDGNIGSLTNLPVLYNNLACILYTSGTTGTPKGVKITRKSVLNVAESYIGKYGLNNSDVYGLFSAIGFDMSSFVISVVMCAGASLSVIPEEIRFNMSELNRYFIKQNVTHAFITTQVGKLFMQSVDDNSLDVLLVAGEKLGDFENPHDYRLIDAYGPTEAFVVSSINNDNKIDDSSVGLLNYNTKAYVLDNQKRRVPCGAVGELFVSGLQIADGYLNRAEENLNAFIDNPFNDDEDHDTLYATGDMVRILPDGTLGIVGRRDGQVKIRGNRVELGEVESAIRTIPEVEDVTVQTVNNNGNNELAAYVVVSKDLDDIELADRIRGHVKEYKPDYMVPSYVIRLDSIPLNINGKVDRRALPHVNLDDLQAEYVAPTNETEKIIVDAFEKVFNQDKIGINDDFTQLGGDSLTAIKLISHLRDYNISAADILSLRTPKAISENIKTDDFDLGIYSVDEGCPLNEPQLNVYLDIIANEKTDAYLIPLCMDISKKYELDIIVDALNEMLIAHPILGMCVSDEFDVPYLIKGCKPEILVKSDVDNEFLTGPFDLHKRLSRFLIAEKEDRFKLYAVFHHIIFDALSDKVFKQDLLSILEGHDVDVDESFLKASAFSQQIQNTHDYEDAKTFYDSMLADLDEVDNLLDCVNPNGPGLAQCSLNLNFNQLKSYLAESNISENALFTGVFAYALSRFTGSDKVFFNINENGRDRFNNIDSIGMYVSTLPMLVECKNRDVQSFLSYISNLTYNAMKYNYYPFRLLSNEYGIDSNILFQFIPDWIGDDVAEYIETFSENIEEMDDLISDLSVNVVHNGEEYSLIIAYCDKYSKEMIQRFMEVYKLILHEITTVGELKDIDYISKDDLKRLDKINNTERQLNYEDVMDAFNYNLSRNPKATLVSYNDVSYSYGEGAFIADELAKRLADIGVEYQDNVAFLVERSELYMFSALGIMSMGGVYVPLDDAHPDERIKYMIEDTQAKAVICCDNTYERIKSLTDSIILNISDILDGEIQTLSNLATSYGNLACILYTSGSTGIPKGVKITRKSIVNYVDYYVHKFNMTCEDVFAQFASISFDVGAIKSLWVPVYSGASLNIIPTDIKFNMIKLNDYLIGNGATHAHLPTHVAKLFISEVDDTSLKILVTGGEKLGEVDFTGDYAFVDSYGPTECCVSVTAIEQKDKIDPSSIGYLLDNLKAYIVDNEFRRVPMGATGELCIAGIQVGEGYLNREEENANAFIDNPFDDDENYSRLYRTGDMVRILSDDSIGIVGRRDSQVKIRGNRVELGEVESAIRTIPEVEDVTVQTVNNNGNNELAAYAVVSEDLDNAELTDYIRSYVKEHKPDYMVPSYVIRLDSIPLNINGKVDRHSLPHVNLDDLQAEYVAPTNETEKIIVDAFEKVFNQDKIGINDDFTRLGGDSLTAIQLLSHLNEYNITAADILSLKTPKAIAQNLNKANFNLDIYSLDLGCPLNESQLNVYLDIIANNKTSAYLIPLNMDISKRYGRDVIVDALNKMLIAHPILGMCVSDEFEVPYLVKSSNPSIDIAYSKELDDGLFREFFTRSFDLHDRLCRFLIYENKNDKDFVLFGAFHHIIFDALSDAVFKRDLMSILDGKSVALDDSFLRVSAFAEQIKETEEYADAGRFFEGMLADIDETGLLLDSVSSDGPGTTEMPLDLDYELFKSFLNKFNVSENVLFTGVFAYTLSRFAGNDKVLFNLIDNGRDRFNNYDAIGMYVNTLPLLVDCKNQEVSSFFEYLFDLTYDVMRFDYYPFRKLANEYDINSNILFQFLPDWIDTEQNYDNDSVENTLISDMDDLIADFSVFLSQRGKDYTLSIIYSDRYSNDFAQSFAKTYNLILSQIISVKELKDMNYISKSDVRLLDSYNETEHPLEYEDVLDAFNQHLAQSPNSPLVSMHDEVYSYGEGAFIANEIGRRLVEYGVKPQENVAFLIERCEKYVFGVLGILSMGGVYVPLDDRHPDERLEFMIKDTGSKVLIVTNETYVRAQDLIDDDVVLLNMSEIMGSAIGSLTNLPVVYGDLACILYTSGTTGIPKGVKITRKSVINVAESYIGTYDLDNEDVCGLFTAIGFDVTNFVITTVICAGACLSVVPEEIRLNMAELNKYFIKQNVSHAFITTQVGKLFMQSADNDSLDVLYVIGEKLGEVESPHDYRLIDAYGPTEAFAYVSSIDNESKLDASSVGTLNYNTRAYVLDNQKHRVPCGAVGELYLAGFQVADGYLNRPEENLNAFIDNPFDDDEGYDTLYATGDVVRILPDGTLGIVGRRDSQVKIRGNRVELGEIESVIRSIQEVEDVTVQTVNNNDNNELAAYVVVSNDLDNTELTDCIRDYVKEHKPDYMVPSFVIRLDNIPLTVNGKVDRRGLPDVDLDDLQAEYVAPTNEREKIIVAAFEKALNLENVSIHDDFIRLGGDSLTAIKLLGYVKSYDITMADIFTFRTPEAIAKNMLDFSFDLDIYSLESGCPLNSAQINVFADINVYNKRNAYNMPGLIHISKEYVLEDILNALDELFAAHPILSMYISDFYETNDTGMSNLDLLKDLMMTVRKYGMKGSLSLINAYGLKDMRGLYNMLKTIIRLFKGEYPYLLKGSKPPISIESSLDDDIIIDFFTEPLDLHNTLSKFMIVETQDSYYLFYMIHHIIFDAISAGVFKHDFQILLDGGSVDLDETFLKTSAFTHHIKGTDKFDEAGEFFYPILSDLSDVGILPEDGQSGGYSQSFYDLNFDKSAFKTFINNAGISENVLFTSVFAYTLSQFVEGDKVLFTMIENGRDRFNNDNFIGMTSNVLPLVVDCNNQSISSFMQDMADTVNRTLRYSYYPILQLYQRYDFEVNILFQFVPNWIADDYIDMGDFASEEITNLVLDKFNDFLSEFFVQIYQNGDDYRIIFTKSNKYSNDMIRDFKDIYISVLSNIIDADMFSDLNSTLK